MSHPPRLAQARHAFLRLAPPLPLSYDGTPLRSALRQAQRASTALAQSWRDALDALHAAGFGTDDPLGAARVLVGSEAVYFDPTQVYPLGATARRPISAWLDLHEASRWLADQGARPDLVALLDAPLPWPGWPEAPGSLFVLVGPQGECRALCDSVGITAIDARALPALACPPVDTPAHLLAAAHLRQLSQALARRRPIALLAAPDDQRPLPLIARPRLVVQTVGAPPPPAGVEAHEAFGIEPFDIPESPPAPPTARALEDARLFDTPERRAAAEAQALMEAQVDAALRDLPPLSADRAVDLARDGLDRAATQRAHLLRALLLAPLDPRRALADLTEARRLHKDERVIGVARGLHCVISHMLAIEPTDGEASPVLSRLSEHFGLPAWDEDDAHHALTLAACAGLDLPELAPPLTELALGLVVERLGCDAVLDAREEQTERLMGRLVATVALPGPVAALARAWAATCAARRGALSSVRERLVQAADSLQVASSATSPRPLTRLAAERYAYAARMTQKDGLVPLFLDLLDPSNPASPLSRMVSGERALHHDPQLPPWLATLALEGLTSPGAADPGERRRAAPLLAAQILARPGCDLALGGVLAGAIVDRAGKVELSSPIDAPRARELLKRTAHGEPHHERRALALLAALPGGDADEREAIRRRLLALGHAREAGDLDLDPLEPAAEPPIDPPSAERRALRLFAELIRAAAGHPPYEGWRRILTLALGEPNSEIGPASDAAYGLALVEDGDGWLLEPLSGAPRLRFAGPGHPITTSAPELVAQTLAALAPLFGPRHDDAPAHALTAEGLDEALRSGELDFFGGLLPAFKRRELLLPTLRQAVELGLTETRGLYRALANRWRVQDYQRFMDFLRRNDALLDYRPYRRGTR